jgi:hypothetical protein
MPRAQASGTPETCSGLASLRASTWQRTKSLCPCVFQRTSNRPLREATHKSHGTICPERSDRPPTHGGRRKRREKRRRERERDTSTGPSTTHVSTTHPPLLCRYIDHQKKNLHFPRNAAADDRDRDFEGEVIEGTHAPALAGFAFLCGLVLLSIGTCAVR